MSPTTNRLSTNADYASPRDLNVVLEESELTEELNYFQSVLNLNRNYLQTPKTLYNGASNAYLSSSVDIQSILPMRRNRAGTMPSTAYMDRQSAFLAEQSSNINTNISNDSIGKSHSKDTVNNSNGNRSTVNRQRSGSLSLPIPSFQHPFEPPVDNSYSPSWIHISEPSSEQLLIDDNDFSIARTLRSIGLNEDSERGDDFKNLSNSSSLLNNRSALRSRSYSVNNTSVYQQKQVMSSTANPPIIQATSFNGGRNSRVNRPRSSSMGKMDYPQLAPPGLSSPWKMQLDTLHDEENESSISLGDSELLANILHNHKDISQIVPEDTVLNSVDVHNNSNTYLYSQNQYSGTSRSLWIGNIDSTITTDILTNLFSTYGPIESIRLLMEKECAFINYYQLEDAVHAKNDILSNLGGKIEHCVVRVGYGRVESLTTTTPEIPVVSLPTRALWLGNIPTTMDQSSLQRLFSPFGTIESIRLLSHKNCVFINYEHTASASAAKDALLKNDIKLHELWGIRVGFAKVPLSRNTETKTNKAKNPALIVTENKGNTEQINNELIELMRSLGADDEAVMLVASLEPSVYADFIPSVQEHKTHRKIDTNKLREIRKKIDSAVNEPDEIDVIALECLDDIIGICSDYIGNTVVQRLFEKCTLEVRTVMLKAIAPHLASIGVHKNGTWAAQKIIDTIEYPEQTQLASNNIQPFIPCLLLDQYGNYVVQCFLRLEGNSQYIVNAMRERLVNIAQGRFGARAIRGILESSLISASQIILIAATVIQNAALLSTHTNGSLLISWLLDSTVLNNRYKLIALQIESSISQMAVNKIGAQLLLKLIDQNIDEDARDCLINSLKQLHVLQEVTSDKTRGLPFLIKVLSCDYITAKDRLHLKEMTNKLTRTSTTLPDIAITDNKIINAYNKGLSHNAYSP